MKHLHRFWFLLRPGFGCAEKAELIEEYDSTTLELLLRKRRRAKQSGSQGAWEYIQGEDAPGVNAECGVLRESAANVRCPSTHGTSTGQAAPPASRPAKLK